ncbi:hypothetical protein [Faecalibacillus intestinalis]|jgi:hypothetical protein|uniref:hypothetical protein n=1 Tax=Faecalibacillus intestinalis TaxID=1982626 RepID=UPI003AB5A4FC
MFGRKEETKQRKKTEKGKYKILISAILACAVTVGLIKYQEQALSKYETVGVVCVKPSVKSLKEGTVINEETVKKYFSVEQRQKNTVSSTALMDMEKLIGKRTSIELYANDVITTAQFSDINEKLHEISDPVETSINATDLSQLVGGILREGDTIDISVIGDEGQLVYELRDVYVTKAFDSSGQIIDENLNEAGDGTTSNENAMIINVIIEKSDEALLDQQLSNGVVRIAKTNNVVK